MPGVLVKYALVVERAQHAPFLSVEDLVARVGEAQQKGTAENPAANAAMSLSLWLEGHRYSIQEEEAATDSEDD